MCTDKHQQQDRYSSAAGMTASSSNASSSSNRASFASFPGVRTCVRASRLIVTDLVKILCKLITSSHLMLTQHLVTHTLITSSHTCSPHHHTRSLTHSQEARERGDACLGSITLRNAVVADEQGTQAEGRDSSFRFTIVDGLLCLLGRSFFFWHTQAHTHTPHSLT
jgi:hypothetical protein